MGGFHSFPCYYINLDHLLHFYILFSSYSIAINSSLLLLLACYYSILTRSRIWLRL